MKQQKQCFCFKFHFNLLFLLLFLRFLVIVAIALQNFSFVFITTFENIFFLNAFVVCMCLNKFNFFPFFFILSSCFLLHFCLELLGFAFNGQFDFLFVYKKKIIEIEIRLNAYYDQVSIKKKERKNNKNSVTVICCFMTCTISSFNMIF